MKKILVAAIMVLMASPAFAAIQNVKVSGDITSTWLYRSNFDLGLTAGTECHFDGDDCSEASSDPLGLKRQNVFITQTRIRIDADLSDNVSTTVGLINERAWNGENTDEPGTNFSLDTSVELYLASVTMREFLYSPLTVTVGCQIFNYGNGLVMGDGGVNNQATGNLQFIAQDLTMRTAYDGIKAVLDYKPLTIDLFYFKNGQSTTNGFWGGDKASSDVYGVNANYQLSDPMNTLLEAYLFSRINGNGFTGSETGISNSPFDHGDTLYVPGLRVSTNPIKGLNTQAEIAWQLGNHPVGTTGVAPNNQEVERRQAMAAQLMASYSLPVLEKYKPTLNASYTYVSGDKNANLNNNEDSVKSTKTFTAWDPFNESQGSGTIYNTLFNLSNMQIVSVGATVNPLEDVTVGATWSGLWEVARVGLQNFPVLVQPDGGFIIPATTSKRDPRGLGNEYDANVSYAYTEDVTFGVSVGWFVPGPVFQSVNRNVASQAMADVAVKF